MRHASAKLRSVHCVRSIVRRLFESVCFAVGGGHRVYVWHYERDEMMAWCQESLSPDRWRHESFSNWTCSTFTFRHRADEMIFRLRWSERLTVHRQSVEREIQEMKQRRAADLKHVVLLAMTCCVMIFLMIAVLNLLYDIVVWLLR